MTAMLLFDDSRLPALVLCKDEYVLGRGAGCDHFLSNTCVSRCHARIARREGGWSIEDLGSRNGTKVNGELCSGVVTIAPGDEITLGEVRALFVERDEAPAPAAESDAQASPQAHAGVTRVSPKPSRKPAK